MLWVSIMRRRSTHRWSLRSSSASSAAITRRGRCCPQNISSWKSSACPGRRSSSPCLRYGRTAGSPPSRGGAVSCGDARPWPTRSGPGPRMTVLELPETTLNWDLVQAGVKVATPQVAALLGLEAGAKAFLRQRILSEEGEPVELASAWLPLELAAGTDLASPNLLDESIRHHLQAKKRVRFDHAVERISARRPNGEEAALLHVAPDTPRAQCDRHRVRRVGPAVAGDRHRAAGRPARDPRRLPLHLTASCLFRLSA